MTNKNEYNLTFHEALKCLFNGECWVQGEDFGSEVVLCLNDDVLSVYNFWKYEKPIISRGLVSQKFRKVYTQPGAKK